MADVDFSHAVLDVNTGYNPMTNNNYLNLATASLANASGQIINSNASQTIITNTPSKVSLLYTGTLGSSGTEFYLYYSGNVKPWKVSNISFSSGDTYSFVIDIETSGNT